MQVRTTPRKWVAGGAALGVVLLLALTTFAGSASGKAQHVTWDIVHFTPIPPTLPPNPGTITFSPGGVASAQTHAGVGAIQTITLTGHGTFVAPASGKGSGAATGGGTWSISGGEDGGDSGSYVVRDLVSWEFANMQGGLPGKTIIDQTGDVDERANGTAVLRIEFDDGQWGVLTVGCHGPGAPANIFEGIALTKGFKTYDVVLDPPGFAVDANRTIFHVVG